MNNKEAIEILKEYKLILENVVTDKADEDIKAFELAIDALGRDGTMPYYNGEPTVCVCPVCGSVWKINEVNNETN